MQTIPDTRHASSSLQVIPVTFAASNGSLVANKAVLEVVEDGELVAGHDIVVWLGLDLGPDVGKGLVEHLEDGGILGAVGALAGNLESLGDFAHGMRAGLGDGRQARRAHGRV